jgi:hypothetical protein
MGLGPDIDSAILPWAALHTLKRADFPVTSKRIVRSKPALAAMAQRAIPRQTEID